MDNLCNDRQFCQWASAKVVWCQTVLVDELLKREVLSYDDISNLYDEETDEYREVFEWWLVDRWLLDTLENNGVPVLRSDYGSWWGRTTTGQSYTLDEELQEIYRSFNR